MKYMFLRLTLGAVVAFTTSNAFSNDITLEELAQEVNAIKIKSNNMQAELEGNEKSGFQLAGYSSFGWSDTENGTSDFDLVQFSPIFHYQYSDIFQFEGELEILVDANGETQIELEYAAGNLFINDYMVFVAGKFMSPVGQFVQNLHPAWINKLPSAPMGFGHDGAAISSNVGVALRGGLPKVLNTRSNYALFIANAPMFEVAPDGDTIINTQGRTSSNGVPKTIGGRFALNPLSNMEIGISGSKGKIAEVLASGTLIQRDYKTTDIDFMYNINSFDIKAEYIRQTVGTNSLSPLDAGTWKAYYGQITYQFSFIKLEPVLRYSNYSNPEIVNSQVAFGCNYLFSNNVIAKLAYENNIASSNRILAQFAFGF